MRLPRQKGFTLVELVYIMAIIGILAALSYAGMNVMRRERVNSKTRQILSDIQKTRADALISVSTSTYGKGIRFTAGAGGSYTMFTWNDTEVPPDFLYQAGEELAGTVKTMTLPPTVTLTVGPLLTQCDGGSLEVFPALVYNRLGYPQAYKYDASGNSTQLTCQALNLFISDVGSDVSKCIQITANSIREGVVSGTTCSQL